MEIDRQIDIQIEDRYILLDGQIDRQIVGRQIDIQKDRQIDILDRRQVDRQIDRQTDRQIDRQRERLNAMY